MKRTRLRPVSKKREIENRAYEKAKREWRKNHDGRCELRYWGEYVLSYVDMIADGEDINRCRNKAGRNPHHRAKRGRQLSNIDYFMGVCPKCHRWIHEHENKARELGYLVKL